ncbi:MAG: YcaO-like family protein [Desulfosarcina sp.]|nr:YcaO-like family protein [Desulfosarcina sp.]MBC2765424.1 YcaO-like family protein [Desulfosarcina sp.]
MSRPATSIHFLIDLKETAASIGYFAAVPRHMPTIEEGLAYLRRHPNDSFMHTHLLGRIGEMEPLAVVDLLESEAGNDPAVRALLLEAGTVYEHLAEIKGKFKRRETKALADRTPLVFLRSELLADQAVHRQWARLFHANITRHRPLPPPATTGLSFPVEGVDGCDEPLPAQAHLKAIIDPHLPDMDGSGTPRPPLEETIDHAMARLSTLELFEGTEMRHESSLSLYALLRKWHFNHQVKSGELNYTVSSTQTSYGRGLSLKAARASCLMEVVERCSSFASVDETGIVGTRRLHPVIRGSLSQLTAGGYPLLDPNGLGLEVPYRNEPLYWMEGERLTAGGTEPIWMPVQCVFLFCNLDERSLFSGLGSTGLASGNTVAEARLSALGIHLQFQDISPAFGIPCCTCFVTHRDGTVVKGGGANLNGKRAVLSALTETPYPYPVGPPSAPVPPDLPWLQFESLPDFSTGTPNRDLMLVDGGLRPILPDKPSAVQ